MKKLLIAATLIGFFFLSGTAQDKDAKSAVSSKPILRIFSNFHGGKDNVGFDLDRGYLGYEFKAGSSLKAKVVFDAASKAGENKVSDRSIFLKNAGLTWSQADFTLDFGLIGTQQFSVQEKYWGYRYVAKSFQDQYKFGSSADLGVTAKYKFHDVISADLSFLNGQGYKKVEHNNKFKYGAGLTITPIKGLVIRAYADLLQNGLADSLKGEHQKVLALFVGYKHKIVTVGAEYNNMKNQKFGKDKDLAGYSVYANVAPMDKLSIYARYDNFTNSSKKSTDAIISGVEYVVMKQLKISPNIRVDNIAFDNTQVMGYLNLEVRL